MEAARHLWPALGVLLLRDGLVTTEELNAILESQRDAGHARITGSRLGEIVVDRGIVADEQVARLLAEQYELPFVTLGPESVDPRAGLALSDDDARRFSALPIGRRPDGSYDVAIADPSTVVFSDQLRQILGSIPHFAVVGKQAFATALAQVSAQRTATRGPAIADVVEMWPDEPAAADEAPHERRALARSWPPLGALLVRDGLLTDDQLDVALTQQRLSTNKRLGELLVESGVVSSSVIARLLAEQYELPYVELADLDVDPAMLRLLPEETSRTQLAVPFGRREDGSLDVAIADPTNVFYSDDLHVELGVPVNLAVAAPDAIAAFITRCHGTPTAEAVDTPEAQPTQTAGDLDAAFTHALAAGASHVRISAQTSLTTQTVAVSRRDRSGADAHNDGIALEDHAARLVREIMDRPGVVVVDGAAAPLRGFLAICGSGQSVVAAIEERLDSAFDQAGEPEDDGAFALSAILEALGRLEVSAISVDAPLDAESAAIVVRLAHDGRTVLVRAIDGDTAGAICDLIALGDDADLRSAVVSLLHLRRLCTDCRAAYYASSAELARLGLPPGHRLLARAKGCASCTGTGFRGEVTAVAALTIGGDLTELARRENIESVREELSAREAAALHEDAVRLCLDGLTSSDELTRAVRS